MGIRINLNDFQAEVLQGLLAEQIADHEYYATLQPLYEQLVRHTLQEEMNAIKHFIKEDN